LRWDTFGSRKFSVWVIGKLFAISFCLGDDCSKGGGGFRIAGCDLCVVAEKEFYIITVLFKLLLRKGPGKGQLRFLDVV
jgi:hypothetical protein